MRIRKDLLQVRGQHEEENWITFFIFYKGGTIITLSDPHYIDHVRWPNSFRWALLDAKNYSPAEVVGRHQANVGSLPNVNATKEEYTYYKPRG